jgi:hypothetical protein
VDLAARLEAHDLELGARHVPVLTEGVIPIDRTLADPLFWAKRLPSGLPNVCDDCATCASSSRFEMTAKFVTFFGHGRAEVTVRRSPHTRCAQSPRLNSRGSETIGIEVVRTIRLSSRVKARREAIGFLDIHRTRDYAARRLIASPTRPIETNNAVLGSGIAATIAAPQAWWTWVVG